MSKSAKIFMSAVVVATAISAVPVSAQKVPGANAEVKAAKVQAKCDTLTTKIDTHISRANAAINKQAAIYDKHDARVDALINKAKTAGLDTSKAEADLATWEAKTAAIKTARDQVISDLNTIKSQQCADQKDQYKQGLASAKTSLTSIRAMQNDRKAYFKSTVKPDLQDLRNQLKNQ